MNPAVSPVPAAQYIRMSSEHQKFSLENQTAALRLYAEKNDFTVVKTYVDAGRTGVVLKHREGLAALLRDVVQGDQSYRVVLVYDVSRWGRFQDTDEAAYYEFLCKMSGFPVHYAAETFSNDATMCSSIMKALKRVMAAEYSRELGVKVHAGHQRLVRLGFKQGGQPGYGLRRLLVSADGKPKHLLGKGERKSIATDRVIQVPGPAEEVRCVKQIYEMFIQKRMTFKEITKELNHRRIRYTGGSRWYHTGRSVSTILTNPKYAGFNVYGRSTKRLYAPSVKVPRSDWTIVPAFEALVEPATFAEAQRIVGLSTRNRSDESLLDALRAGLARQERAGKRVAGVTLGVPAANTYRLRFGALSRTYELVGYDGFWRGSWLEKRRCIQLLREDLMKQIVALFGDQVSIENRGPALRTRLRLDAGQVLSVVMSRAFRTHEGSIRWRLQPISDERRLVTLVARLNVENSSFRDLFVIPPIGTCKRMVLKENDPRLNRGVRLGNLGEFLSAAQRMSVPGVL